MARRGRGCWLLLGVTALSLARHASAGLGGLFDGVVSAVEPPAVVLWRTHYDGRSERTKSSVAPLFAVGDVLRHLGAQVEGVLRKQVAESPQNCSGLVAGIVAAVGAAERSLDELVVRDAAVMLLARSMHGLPGLGEELQQRLWPRIHRAAVRWLGPCKRERVDVLWPGTSLLQTVELEARNLLMLVSAKLVSEALLQPSTSQLRLWPALAAAPTERLRRDQIMAKLLAGRKRFIELGAGDLAVSLAMLDADPSLTVVAVDPWYDKTMEEVEALKAPLLSFPNAAFLRDTAEGAAGLLALAGAGCFDALFVDANVGEGVGLNFCNATLAAWAASGLVCPGALVAGHDYMMGEEHSVGDCVHWHASGRDIYLGHDWTWWFYM